MKNTQPTLPNKEIPFSSEIQYEINCIHSVSQQTLKVGIIGAGRVGRALIGAYAQHRDYELVGFYNRGSRNQQLTQDLYPNLPNLAIDKLVQKSQLLWLCVTDNALEPLLSEISQSGLLEQDKIILHTCGSRGIEVYANKNLNPTLAGAIHPVMTFSGNAYDVEKLYNCYFAITAPSPLDVVCEGLVCDLSGHSFMLPEEKRPAYHAALCHSANYINLLVNQSLELLEHLNLPNSADILTPLLSQSLSNVLAAPHTSLTGPIARADTTTITKHLAALIQLIQTHPTDNFSLQNIYNTYKMLGSSTVKQAFYQKNLSTTQTDQLIDLFDN